MVNGGLNRGDGTPPNSDKLNSKYLGGEIGRRAGLKILWTVMSVPVRLRPEVPKKKVYSRTPSLDKNPSFLLESL